LGGRRTVEDHGEGREPVYPCAVVEETFEKLGYRVALAWKITRVCRGYVLLVPPRAMADQQLGLEALFSFGLSGFLVLSAFSAFLSRRCSSTLCFSTLSSFLFFCSSFIFCFSTFSSLTLEELGPEITNFFTLSSLLCELGPETVVRWLQIILGALSACLKAFTLQMSSVYLCLASADGRGYMLDLRV
jgi:hypothetical protein